MRTPILYRALRLSAAATLALLAACAQAPTTPGAASATEPQLQLSPEERATFFVHAARSGDLAETRKQLAAGAQLDGFDTLDQTALIAAVDHNQIEIIRFLLDKGANPNLGDHAGWTPLIHAAYFGANEELLSLLIDRGADVNGRNDRGVSALYLAAAVGREDQVRVLLKHGADPALASKAGYTPKQVAQMRGLERIVALLDGKEPPAGGVISTPSAAPAAPVKPQGS